jgi:hypothetical protein
MTEKSHDVNPVCLSIFSVYYESAKIFQLNLWGAGEGGRGGGDSMELQ